MTDINEVGRSGPETRSASGVRFPGWRAVYGVAGVILAFCAYAFYLTTTFEEVPAALGQGVPPTQFPRLLILVIAVLTVLMVVEARRVPPKVRSKVPSMVYLTAGLLTISIVAIHWIGIFASLMFVCAALPVLWGDRRYVRIGIFTIVFPILTFLLFSEILEIRFPKGLVEQLFY